MRDVPPHTVSDLGLAPSGREKVEWARENMPVLSSIADRFKRERPFEGKRLAACLHVTSETAVLMNALADGGAEVALCASNPLSTQDDVAASLVADFSVGTFAVRGDDRDAYYSNIENAMSGEPVVTLDDGGDLSTYAHEHIERYGGIVGGTEETTTGVIRFRAMEAEGALKYPIVAVNDSRTKFLFDNRYGTGQSTIDGLLRATNRLVAGSVFVVAGYGWCGRGVAARAKGMGARVIVTEVEPVHALEAAMDGFEVMRMESAVPLGDIFVTVTGDKSVITLEHMRRMKSGAIVANSGHFDVEVEVERLREAADRVESARPNVERFVLGDKRVYVVAEGRLVNLSAAEGHPSNVMDMSFANQALAVEFLLSEGRSLPPAVHALPEAIDREIASLKLSSMGISIDTLTGEQERYLKAWKEGT